MPAPVQCDQCGCTLNDEDFHEGGAFRDRADILCAKCYKMYQKDERRCEREKLAGADTTTKVRTAGHGSGRAHARGPGRGTERRPRGSSRRGATRTMTTARRAGARRAPEKKSGLAGVFVIAALIAFVVAAGIIYALKKKPSASRAASAPTRTTPLPPPPPPGGTSAGTPAPAPKPSTKPSPAPPKKAEPDKRNFGKSLFGPGGEYGDRK